MVEMGVRPWTALHDETAVEEVEEVEAAAAAEAEVYLVVLGALPLAMEVCEARNRNVLIQK